MGFISRLLVVLVQIGCFISGLYCAYQYLNIWRLAKNATHEVTGTLFGIGAILSFGTVAIIALLEGVINIGSDIVEATGGVSRKINPYLANIQDEIRENTKHPTDDQPEADLQTPEANDDTKAS